MNIYITYFYNVRFFPKNLIPVSTAVYDPKWFHNFNKQCHIFQDKRGIWNGLRIEELAPHGIEGMDNFLMKYYRHIHNVSFRNVYRRLESIVEQIRKLNNDKDNYDICLLVHEKPDNPNSERPIIIGLFKENGISIKEWTRPS